MSTTHAEGISITQTKSATPELPSPQGAIDSGFIELFRLWYRQPDATQPEPRVDVQIRSVFENPLEWSEPIAMMAYTIAEFYGQKITPDQKQHLAALLILKAADRLGLGHVVESYAAASLVEDQPGVDEGHPNGVPVPPEILENPEAKQLLNVWIMPDIDECDHCGDSHEGETYIGGQTDVLAPKDLGNLLGTIAKIHSCELHPDNAGERMKTVALVQQAFNEVLDQGLAGRA